MNYIPADNPKILEDLTRRKEFYQYGVPAYDPDEPRSRLPDGWVQKYDLNETKEEDVAIEFSSYQNYVANFLNPETPYSRLLLKWQPGSGKTLAAINIAMQFIRQYERESQMDDIAIGSVFVIGFTEEIFKRDLLSFPKFGFISRDELKQLQMLREAAQYENKTDVERLQEFTTRLKKRLSSRKENGYFRFFGYKAFVNRIFMLQDFKRNINDMSEDEIRQSLKDGSLKWNRALLDSFRNSLLICDEIHNVYNSLEKNNWGVAIQMVLDQDPTIKAVFMSATPINNNPTEVIDLGNLISAGPKKLIKDDFFDGKTLRAGALDRIAAIFRGRVSFIQDTDPRHFATQEIVGDTIPGIPYLKFIRCPMSAYHYRTYKEVYTGVLAQDAQYLMDIAFPNPQGPIGLYRTNEIKRALSFADEAWTKKMGFKIINDVIVGTGLEEAHLSEWSTKMATLLQDIKKDLTPHGGKILVYHDVVHMSGVLFIEQILVHNGFIGIDQNPTDSTLCAVCGELQKGHVSGGNGGNGGNNRRIEAATKEIEAKIKALYRRVCNEDLPGEVTPCTTRVAFVGDEPAAFVQWYPEDAGVTRIDALVPDPARPRESFEELLEQTPDTVLTVVVPERDLERYALYSGKYFVEHDRADGKIYMNFSGLPEYQAFRGAPYDWDTAREAFARDAVKLQRYRTALLVPRWEREFTKLRVPVAATDIVVLLIGRDNKQIAGHLVTTASREVRAVAAPPAVAPEAAMLRLMMHLSASATTGGQPRKKKSQPEPHAFQPARYIMAHSDMDKSVMQKHIDRFNSIDNTWGYNCRVIVGSKIIKESYNFKAIRKVKVTARPANIATLVQILGRSRRKKAHTMLPPEFRTIECKIFTSCLPVRERVHNKLIWALSHEETKYREKMADYQVIQQIEQRMHETAIDAATARAIVLPGLDRKNPSLDALWFEPEVCKKAALCNRRYGIKDLNLSTFSIFHSESEIQTLIYIIKRLFVETSLCFTYADLWRLVREPPFHVEQDCALFQEDYFVIALSMLVYGAVRDATVRPLARGDTAQRTYLLDILHSAIDKRIMQPDRTLGHIHHIAQYYIFIPFRNGQHDIFAESTFRTFDLQPNRPINIMRYIKESSLTLNYENQKLKFKNKYENVPLERLATVMGKFSVNFHQIFVEEIIKYVFELWTTPSITAKSEMHEFYFKMLYYYDLMGLIVWAASAKEFIREMYKPWMLPLAKRDEPDGVHQIEMSLNRSKPEANLKISNISLMSALKSSIDTLAKRVRDGKTKVPIARADPKLLPIGHFIATVPRFFHPEKDWFESPEYVQRTQDFRENDVLVGYYEKSGTGLRVKFKIRTPVHKIEKHKDIRMIEKGSICSSNSKEYLIEMAKKLKIKIPDKINVPNLCQEIEEQLQLNELEERRKKSNVKWFYAAWEAHEGKRVEQSLSSSSPQGGAGDKKNNKPDNMSDMVPVDSEQPSDYVVPDEEEEEEEEEDKEADYTEADYVVPIDGADGADAADGADGADAADGADGADAADAADAADGADGGSCYIIPDNA